MAEKSQKAIISATLSSQYDKRWIIVDTDTGEVLDDAQGYGYRSAQNAYAAYSYKTRSPKDRAKQERKKAIIKKWCKENKSFVRIMDSIAFEIAKGSWGPNDKFDTALVKKMLEENGYKDLPFTAYELLRYWEKE